MARSSSYVLILETDPQIVRSMRELFIQEGIETKDVTEGDEGIARIMEQDPGIVLLAEDMPPLGGVELLPLIRRLTGAPIIVMGNGGETAVINALLQGADMYLLKSPLNYREMSSRVRALLRRYDSPQNNYSGGLHTGTTGHKSISAVKGAIIRISGFKAGLGTIPWGRSLAMWGTTNISVLGGGILQC